MQIVIVGSNGQYFKVTQSDKNYDPEYTKVQEMGDTIKSFNIAASKVFQTAVHNENLRQYAQNRRVKGSVAFNNHQNKQDFIKSDVGNIKPSKSPRFSFGTNITNQVKKVISPKAVQPDVGFKGFKQEAKIRKLMQQRRIKDVKIETQNEREDEVHSLVQLNLSSDKSTIQLAQVVKMPSTTRSNQMTQQFLFNNDS